MLMETLVYLGLVFLLLGVGFMAMYRCIDNSVVLSRNADDITSALHAGERWRADVRAAGLSIQAETIAGQQMLHMTGASNDVYYAFWRGAVLRRVGEGAWTTMLERVKASAMEPDPRPNVAAWRWEVELQPRGRATVKPSRIRPLFTFLAVPKAASNQ